MKRKWSSYHQPKEVLNQKMRDISIKDNPKKGRDYKFDSKREKGQHLSRNPPLINLLQINSKSHRENFREKLNRFNARHQVNSSCLHKKETKSHFGPKRAAKIPEIGFS